MVWPEPRCLAGQASYETQPPFEAILPAADLIAGVLVGLGDETVEWLQWLMPIILDTNWKVPKNGQPADDDLKQMYAYNLHMGARRSLLIYPGAHPSQSERLADFAPSLALPASYRHCCAMCFVDLFDTAHRLRKDIGSQLAQRIFATAS